MKVVDTLDWEPEVKVNTATDLVKQSIKQTHFRIDYNWNLNESIGRKSIYKNNLTELYALLWEHFTEMLKEQISGYTNFNANTFNSPISLLRTVK